MSPSAEKFKAIQGQLGAFIGTVAIAVLTISGCGLTPKQDVADAQSRRGGENSQGQGPASVDVKVAQIGAVQTPLEYVGTTQPYRQVSLRAQVEGQLLQLNADVGDAVGQGQVLAQIDDKVLTTAVLEAGAELAALESEVAQARAQVGEAVRQVESSRLQFQQAQADLLRFEKLYRAGAIAQQQVEQTRTAAGTAKQALSAAQSVVGTRQQAVQAAQRRVAAQQAVIAREQERQSYTMLKSPVNGVVLERISEPGNLAQVGSEILKLGDFSQIKVSVQVSELELNTIRVGQPVQVKLDAFPKLPLRGQVSRVSPVADATARLVPIEVTIPNTGGRIGGGLLARVSFTQPTAQVVVVPENALQVNRKRGASSAGGSAVPSEQTPRRSGTLFVLQGSETQATDATAKVLARRVTLGDRQDGQVEVLAGLAPGDRFVVRSSKPLKSGDPVKLSILSESKPSKSSIP